MANDRMSKVDLCVVEKNGRTFFSWHLQQDCYLYYFDFFN